MHATVVAPVEVAVCAAVGCEWPLHGLLATTTKNEGRKSKGNRSVGNGTGRQLSRGGIACSKFCTLGLASVLFSNFRKSKITNSPPSPDPPAAVSQTFVLLG